MRTEEIMKLAGAVTDLCYTINRLLDRMAKVELEMMYLRDVLEVRRAAQAPSPTARGLKFDDGRAWEEDPKGCKYGDNPSEVQDAL